HSPLHTHTSTLSLHAALPISSFNRAFQSVHGISPIAAKEKGAILNAYPPIRFSVKVSGGSAMSYHIIEKSAFRIVGIRMKLVDRSEEHTSELQSRFDLVCRLL